MMIDRKVYHLTKQYNRTKHNMSMKQLDEEYVRECRSKIVGTTEWCLVKQRVAILEGRGDRQVYDDSVSKQATFEKNRGATSELIDRILSFIEKGEWVQIEVGEYSNWWLNPKHYPNKIFSTGIVKEKCTGEIHYFPLSSIENDPKGLALHYEMYGAGSGYNIKPNIWRIHSTFKQRKRESRQRRKKEREINDIAYGEMGLTEDGDSETSSQYYCNNKEDCEGYIY